MLHSPGHSPRHISSSPASVISTDEPEINLPLSIEAPPSKRRKNAQVVLDEDTYVAAIEKIIERDYFPDLPKLQDRLEWLEAVRSGDPMQMRDTQLKIQERRRARAGQSSANPTASERGMSSVDPFCTPAGGLSAPWTVSVRSVRSPSLAPQDSIDGEQRSTALSDAGLELPVDDSTSLDDFLKKHTSEDNASFSKIIEKMNRKRKEQCKYLLEAADSKNSTDQDQKDRITDGYGTSNQPPSTLESWKYNSKNLLMYDSTDKGEASLTKAEREERLKGLTKEIVAKNTRFNGKVIDSRPKEEDPVSILYTPVAGATPASWPFAERDAEKAKKGYDLEDLRKTPLFGDEKTSSKDGTLQGTTGGYSFVRTPSPAPGVDESPFITWGEIEGTPLRLDEDDDALIGINGSGDGPHFKIPEPPSRDVKARSLSRIASRNLREKSKVFQKPPRTPIRSGSASPSFYSLSPAAQKFVRKAMAKSGHSVDATLRASYSASTTPGTPKMARNATKFEREGSVLSRSSLRESSVSVRSPTPET